LFSIYAFFIYVNIFRKKLLHKIRANGSSGWVQIKVNVQLHAIHTLLQRRKHTVNHRMAISVGPTVVMDMAIKRENPAQSSIKPQPSNT
jgi:retron-type reverse transcriptase